MYLNSLSLSWDKTLLTFFPAMFGGSELPVGSCKQMQHVSQGHGVVIGPYAEQPAYISLPTPRANVPAHGVSRGDFVPEAKHVAVKMNQQDAEQTDTYYGGAMTAMAVHGVKVTSVPSFISLHKFFLWIFQ